MILSRKQAERFERLYGGLVKYMYRRFQTVSDLLELLAGDDGFDKFGITLQEMIWGPDGDLTLLDDYMREQYDFSLSDIEEVMSWKRGLFGTFAAHREGDETIFVRDGRAFAVRGIMHELDRGMAMPVSAETVILPFDGLVTYGMIMMTNPLGRNRSSAQKELRACLDEGRVARTADEYELLRDFKRSGGPRAVNDWPLEGQHRSEYADLPWAERLQVFDDCIRELTDASHARFLDERVTPGKPTMSLVECVMRLTKSEIEALARRDGVGGPLSKMRKAELAEAYVTQIDTDPTHKLEHYLPLRFSALENLEVLMDNGGRIDMDLADFASEDDLPVPDRPMTWLFRNGSGYSLVMPDRFLEAFCALPAGELSAWIERGRTLEAISRRITTMVEVKGIVDIVEVVSQVQELLEDGDFLYYLPPLMTRADLKTHNFRFVELADREELFVAHEMLCLDDQAAGDLTTLTDPATVEVFLMQGQRGLPRDFDEFGDGLDYFQWARSRAPYRALVSYLDGRVPDGADDRTWAVDYADQIASNARLLLSVKDEAKLMKAADLELSAHQHKRVSKLISDLVNDMPRWVNGGWSRNEISQLFGSLAGGGGKDTGRERSKPKPKPKMKSVPRGQKGGRAHKKRRR